VRKSAFNSRLDEIGREEGERDRHVDSANAAANSWLGKLGSKPPAAGGRMHPTVRKAMRS
jgi:hypothetical protein